MSIVKVEKQGMMTTVQDKGRRGYQQYGITESGVMDPWALRWANLLAGNPDSAAGIEVTLMGPQLLFSEDTTIAVGGADLTAQLDGTEIPLWTSIPVKAGQRLHFGKPRQGVRAYIAIHGGIDTPLVLGSRSTYIKAKLGGFRGRELRNGDELPVGPQTMKSTRRKRLHQALLPDYDISVPIRVLPGPDTGMFPETALQTFFSKEYALTNEVDRMGYRLDGPPLSLTQEGKMISDAVAMGTIQIPASGYPLLLLADRQTSGGYARIGSVIHADLSKTAQLGPGKKVRFTETTLEEAHDLLKRKENRFQHFKKMHQL
ncbi:biotin-dependent carboxyltransferase family protein [Alkalicoccus daliensis]|uniref:Antagonist of KipI n=1 Tax=Alkalicoccus daliensis TaxID=745820 RepID=A0A1H0J4D5_9BACI|nr:biotin-dependent carboxyltransferase family protein [Alkalicoccus daliensis]SDO38462.1 antagonist of KipI [Alkalicoccus daliensis]